MKKIIIALVMCLCVGSVSAQNSVIAIGPISDDTYKVALKEVFTQTSSNVNPEKMADAIKNMVGSNVPSAVIEKYIAEQLENDIIDLVTPYYEPYVTYGDLTFLTEQYAKPEIIKALGQLGSLADIDQNQLMQQLQQPLMTIMMGGQPENVKPNAGISKEYIDACIRYCEKAGVADAFETLKVAFDKMPDENAKTSAYKAFDYLKVNLPTVFVNVLHGHASLDDFKVMMTIYDSEAYEHVRNANKALITDVMPFTMKLIEKAKAYAESGK